MKVELIHNDRRRRLIIINNSRDVPSETFIRSHVSGLKSAFEVVPLYGGDWTIADETDQALIRGGRYIGAVLRHTVPSIERSVLSRVMGRILKQLKTDTVLAEYGPIGVSVLDATRHAGVPLFVFFRGYDASIREVLDSHTEGYRRLFCHAAGIIGVSRTILRRLEALGAPADRLHLNPSGIDPTLFDGAQPEATLPHFLAVGRMVEKKAPYLTVLAFAQVAESFPDARLTIVGEGPLMGPSKRMACALGLERRIAFPGMLSPDQISQLMCKSRAFVQHSLEAENGDSEGTPNSIMEAQMSGLPVVATLHAGIPDVVIDGQTGFLVAEGDTQTMGERMLQLALDPEHAGRLGRNAREHALENFTLERHLRQLIEIIERGAATWRSLDRHVCVRRSPRRGWTGRAAR